MSAPARTDKHGVDWRTGLFIFAIAVLFRGAYLAEATRHPEFNLVYMDEEYHLEWAKGLVTNAWTAPYDQIREQSYFRAPLYPYFLALVFRVFGVHPLVARVIQILIGSVSCVLVYAVGTRCFGRRVGLTAGLLCGCSWVLAYHDGELLLPVLEVFLMMAGFNVIIAGAFRRSPAIMAMAGVLFGLFAITRPNILACLPIFIVWVFRTLPRYRRTAAALALAVGFLVPPLAVTLRNRMVVGDWVIISSQGGVNFYIGNNPDSDGLEAWVPGTRHTWWGGYEDARAMAQRDQGRALMPSEVSMYWLRRGLRYISDDPVGWLRLTGRKVVALLGSVEVPNNEPEEARRGRYWTLRASPVSFGLLFGLFLVALPGLLRWRERTGGDPESELRYRCVSLLLQVALVYAVTILAFFVTGRYRVPLVPLISIGSAVTLVRIWDDIVDRRRRDGLVRFGVTALLVAGLSVDYLGIRRGTEGYAILSDAQDLLELGDLDGAIGRLESLRVKGSIRVPEVFTTLAKAYLRRDAAGDRAAVLSVAEDALRIHPHNPELLWYAIAGHLEGHRYGQAETWLARYLEVRPDDLRALRVGFGLALSRGDTTRAAELLGHTEKVEGGGPTVNLMRGQLGLVDDADRE